MYSLDYFNLNQNRCDYLLLFSLQCLCPRHAKKCKINVDNCMPQGLLGFIY